MRIVALFWQLMLSLPSTVSSLSLVLLVVRTLSG